MPRIVPVVLMAGSLACGGSPTSPTVQAAPIYSVSGTVRAGQSAATIVSGARVEVADGPFAGKFTVSDEQGIYRLLALNGTFHLRVIRPGYDQATLSVGPLTADTVMDVSLTPEARTLTGHVTEAAPTESTPITGAQVEVVAGNVQGATATTDGSGAFSINGARGPVDLLVRATAYQDTTVKVNTTAGTAADIRLLPVPATITETVGQFSGPPRPPTSFFRNVHNAGTIVVERLHFPYVLSDVRTIEVWDGERRLAAASVTPATYYTTALRAAVPGGARYEIRIGGGTWHAVTISSPN